MDARAFDRNADAPFGDFEQIDLDQAAGQQAVGGCQALPSGLALRVVEFEGGPEGQRGRDSAEEISHSGWTRWGREAFIGRRGLAPCRRGRHSSASMPPLIDAPLIGWRSLGYIEPMKLALITLGLLATTGVVYAACMFC